MEFLTYFPNILLSSFHNLLNQFLGVMPQIFAALVVFIFGLFVSEWLGKLVHRVLKKLGIDSAINKTGFKVVLEKIGLKYSLSKVLGLLVTWFLYVVFLIAIADILGLSQITDFLRSIVLYIPNVVVAVVILVIGIVVSDLVKTVIDSSVKVHNLAHSEMFGVTARWAILIFAIMAALVHLKVASELVTILFTGLVAMLALAGGLAFGLGSQDKVADWMKGHKKNGKR